MSKIRVLVKEPGKPSEAREIENTLEAFQAIVGGHIEALRIRDNLCCYVNEDGKLCNLRPNFVIAGQYALKFDIIVGTAVFFRSEEGEDDETSLTLTDIIYLDRLLSYHDAANFVINGRPLSELWEGAK